MSPNHSSLCMWREGFNSGLHWEIIKRSAYMRNMISLSLSSCSSLDFSGAFNHNLVFPAVNSGWWETSHGAKSNSPLFLCLYMPHYINMSSVSPFCCVLLIFILLLFFLKKHCIGSKQTFSFSYNFGCCYLSFAALMCWKSKFCPLLKHVLTPILSFDFQPQRDLAFLVIKLATN